MQINRASSIRLQAVISRPRRRPVVTEEHQNRRSPLFLFRYGPQQRTWRLDNPGIDRFLRLIWSFETVICRPASVAPSALFRTDQFRDFESPLEFELFANPLSTSPIAVRSRFRGLQTVFPSRHPRDGHRP